MVVLAAPLACHNVIHGDIEYIEDAGNNVNARVCGGKGKDAVSCPQELQYGMQERHRNNNDNCPNGYAAV